MYLLFWHGVHRLLQVWRGAQASRVIPPLKPEPGWVGTGPVLHLICKGPCAAGLWAGSFFLWALQETLWCPPGSHWSPCTNWGQTDPSPPPWSKSKGLRIWETLVGLSHRPWHMATSVIWNIKLQYCRYSLRQSSHTPAQKNTAEAQKMKREKMTKASVPSCALGVRGTVCLLGDNLYGCTFKMGAFLYMCIVFPYKVLECRISGDRCVMLWMFLMSLNCALKSG